MRIRFVAVVTGVILLGSGGALLGRQAYMEAKAILAERLIARAFEHHLQDGMPHRPWSWADMHPIARLEIDRIGVRRHVLTSASGSSMAFGVGHVDGTALPNSHGNCVLAGHRDTWAEFLGELRPGDRVRLRGASGVRDWVVTGTEVTTASDTVVLAPSASMRLTLVTCYPFNGLLRSRQRYIVTCRPVPESGFIRGSFRVLDRRRGQGRGAVGAQLPVG